MHLFSASQVSAFRECQRKWAWRSIAKIETEPTEAAKLGIEVDDEQLQPYLTTGRAFDEDKLAGQIAKSALEYLPAPMTPGLEVQKRFEFHQPALGFGYQGYMDLWLPPWSRPSEIPCVTDFKTTGNFKWKKDEKALAVDVQAMLYTTYAMFSTGSRVVDLDWIYMRTKGARKAARTHLRVLAPHAVEQFGYINETAKEMFAVRKSLEGIAPELAPLELKPNPDMCDAYGGCPYRDKCNLAPEVFTEANAAKVLREMEDAMVNGGNAGSLMERLRAQREAALAATGPGLAKAGYPASWDEVPAEEIVGINPPAPVGPPPVVPELATAPAVEAPKKRGRPPTKRDPLGADVQAAIATPVAEATTEEKTARTLEIIKAQEKAPVVSEDAAFDPIVEVVIKARLSQLPALSAMLAGAVK